MINRTLPRVVPLLSVPEYTDQITFSEPGLPVGFDSERIMVSLRRLETVRNLAGLGRISVVGGHEVASPQAALDFTYSSARFGEPDATIYVNTNLAEQRIRQTGGIADLYDPKPRARHLDDAVRRGLSEAALHANIDSEKLVISAQYYSAAALIGGVNGNVMRSLAILGALGPILQNAFMAEGSIRATAQYDTKDRLLAWREFRQSLFVGAGFDRAGLANAIIASGRIIKAGD